MTKREINRMHPRCGAPLAGEDRAVAAFLDEESLLHVPGKSGLAGPYQGREAILGLRHRMASLTAHTLRYSDFRVLADNDDSTIVVCRATASRPSKRLDTQMVQAVSFRKGRVGEAWVFYPDQGHVDTFWS